MAARLLEYAGLLLEANKTTNLVGARTLEGLVAPHLLDSLAALAGVNLAEPVLDLGSGGGLPGVPAAIAWRSLRFALLEPRAKRAEFLRRATELLALKNVSVEQKTAQAAARFGWAGQAGTVLARALAVPGRAIVLALPLLRPGGRAVIYQGRAAAPTKGERRIMAANCGRFLEARRIHVPYLDGQRHVWLVEKTST